MYTARYNYLAEDIKKTIPVLNKPEMVSLDFIEDDLPPMTMLEGDEEPEETMAERMKLNFRQH